MTRHRWRTELKGCASEVDVLRVVERYLGEWTAGEMRQLPAGASPGTFTSAKSVTEYTTRLGGLHAAFDGTAASLALLQEILLFFTQASVRITQLRRSDHSATAPGAAPARKPLPDEA